MALPSEAGAGAGRVDYDMKLAGRRVRHAREDHGWSRGELAHRLGSITPEEWTAEKVKFIEIARRRIDPPLLRALAETLGRPADYFLYDDPYTGASRGATGATRVMGPYVSSREPRGAKVLEVDFVNRRAQSPIPAAR